jgi:hypothetical protein
MLSPDSRPPLSVEVIINSGQEGQEKHLKARVLGVDRASDLAVLAVPEGSLGLPKALTVSKAGDLHELDALFVAGFPLGESLGKEITIRPTSVSSLRKKNGVLDRVQVNGGMDPGNSGGPVVDGNGEVVGVAVSGIEGRLINFAIPGERVHTILNGRISGMGIGQPFRENGKLGIPVNVEMIDPRNRITEVALDIWTGNGPPPGKRGRPAADTKPAAESGDSMHEHVTLPYAQGKAEAEVTLPELTELGKVYWIQANWTHKDGKKRWASAVVYRFPSPPVERKPANLVARYAQGRHTVTIRSTLSIKLSSADDEDTFTRRTSARLLETVTQATNQGASVQMQYQAISREEIEGKKVIPDPEVMTLGRFVQLLKVYLQFDGVGKLTGSRPVLNTRLLLVQLRNQQAAQEVVKALKDFHEPIMQGLEAMSIPVPNSEVQPRATWKSENRPLPIPSRKQRSGTIDMTYTYLGRRARNGKDEAIIKIDGTVKSLDKKFGGKATGTALFDLNSGQITKANVSVTMDMDVNLPKSKRSIRVVATVKVSLDRK